MRTRSGRRLRHIPFVELWFIVIAMLVLFMWPSSNYLDWRGGCSGSSGLVVCIGR